MASFAGIMAEQTRAQTLLSTASVTDRPAAELALQAAQRALYDFNRAQTLAHALANAARLRASLERRRRDRSLTRELRLVDHEIAAAEAAAAGQEVVI